MGKIRIQITKGYIITLLFLVFGLFNFFNGMKAYYDSKNAVLLSELKFDECTEGQYVRGSIESYVVKRLETKYFGNSGTLITAMGTERRCVY